MFDNLTVVCRARCAISVAVDASLKTTKRYAARSAHGVAGGGRSSAGVREFINRVKEKAVGHEVNKT